ncbi:GATA zinc finger domain-containing protein 14-like [Cylas formicarius]|uniref:GATA zinc finger domain-containing protein 14-like n=1 Tax=Cylas formicarius TaxID=197179 RepID=UPI0029588062|nr:GATA zinc finger domain-containing protein 14-like [Cylas formicarius]
MSKLFTSIHVLVTLVVIFGGGLVAPSSVVIKSGISKNEGQTKKENNEGVQIRKGIANYEGEEGFNKDDETKSVSAQDAGRYGEQAANNKAHLDSKDFNEENFRQNGGSHNTDFGTKVAHKKGHHKSGFQNSYHKDESGSNSSYFDDGSDEGDEVVRKTSQGAYGDAGRQHQNGGHLDSAQFNQDQARQGNYNNAGRYDKDYGNRRNYNRNNNYYNQEDLDRRNLDNYYQGGRRYAEENYEQRPHYYPQHPIPVPHYQEHYRPLPVPSPKHITIYEDPRYVESDLRYRRSDYGDDYVQLDVRSPLERPNHYRVPDRLPDYYYD